MELLTHTAASVGSVITEALRSFTELFLTQPINATLTMLGEIDLKTLDTEKRMFKAKDLWQKSGAVIMAVRRPG